MILIFRDSLVYHTIFEINRKRVENAVVYSWFSHYKEHLIGYGIDRSLSNIIQEEVNLNIEPDKSCFLEGYMSNTMQANLLNWFVTIGSYIYMNNDIIILVGKPVGYSDQYLDCILYLIKEIYGLSYREVNCEEDIPEVPQDCDQLSIRGLQIIDRTLQSISEYQLFDQNFRIQHVYENMSVTL